MHPVVVQTGPVSQDNKHWDSFQINIHHTWMLIFQGFLFFFLFFKNLFCFCIIWVSRGYQTWVLVLKIIQKWWDWYLVVWGKASWPKSTLVTQDSTQPDPEWVSYMDPNKKSTCHTALRNLMSPITTSFARLCLSLPPATTMCRTGIRKPGQCLLFCFG